MLNLSWLVVLRRTHEELKSEGVPASIEWKAGGMFKAHVEDKDFETRSEVEAPNTTFVDDEALLIEAEDAEMLLLALSRAAVLLRDEAAGSSFQLSCEAGKTEAVVSWQGRGSQQVRKVAVTSDGARVLEVEAGVHVRLV